MATTSGQVWFAYHTDATQGNKDPDTGKATTVSCKAVTFSKNFANAYKVNILPDGSVRNCY